MVERLREEVQKKLKELTQKEQTYQELLKRLIVQVGVGRCRECCG